MIERTNNSLIVKLYLIFTAKEVFIYLNLTQNKTGFIKNATKQ